MPENLKARLIERGYTDVGLTIVDDAAIVSFTNQTHRRLAVALGEVLAIAFQELPTVEQIRLVPQYERQPIGRIDISSSAYRSWVVGSLGNEAFLASLHIRRGAVDLPTQRFASSRFFTDLSLFPTATLEYGAAVGLQEEAHLGLADGLAAEAVAQQALWKVGRDLPPVPLANLTLMRWLAPSIPTVSRIGYFGSRGWGGQIEVGIPLGATEVRLLAGGAERGSLEAIARLYARPGFLNLALRGGVGHFLDGDWGYEGTVFRTFERSTLEGTILKTSHGTDLRAVLTIHLGGTERPRAGSVRIEPGTWSAYYQPESFKIGRTLLLTDDLDAFYQDLYPDEVLQRIGTWPKPAAAE